MKVFVNLQLNTMVGPDIKEIYETKLRDWHLQKDPNFRWCAHVSMTYIFLAKLQKCMTNRIR